MSFANVGEHWNRDEFKAYLDRIQPPEWVRGICLHHTAAPSLAQRPHGLSEQHIRNIRDFYKGKGWKSGPHLFIDDTTECVMGMTPLNERGIHAVSFNANTIGIEILGDYDRESPTKGRGLDAWRNAAAATKALLEWLGIGASDKTVLFHRDDKKTSKSCPGKLVSKTWVLGLIAEA